MDNYSNLFQRTGVPCDDARIDSIENTLGRQLPQAYRELIKTTGGGYLRTATCFISNINSPDADPEGLAVDEIFGNGTTKYGDRIDLADQATFLMDEWELPEEVLLFTTSDDGMHQCFVINYDLPEYPKGSILYLNTDPGGDIALVANTFTEFINTLGPTPNYDPTTDYDEDEELVKAQHYIQTGPPSPTLTNALTHVPDPDAMTLFRTAAHHAASPGGVRIDHRDESRQFIDITYWIIQHSVKHQNVETFAGLYDDSVNPNFSRIVRGTLFPDEPPISFGFSYSLGFLRQWWELRIQEGRLKPTPDGYILDQDYITNVITQLRTQKPTP